MASTQSDEAKPAWALAYAAATGMAMIPFLLLILKHWGAH